MTKSRWPQRGLGEALILVVLIGLGLSRCRPPSLPENPPSTAFDIRNAWRDLEVVARHPHPVGSTNDIRVRDYLQRRLTELGLRPSIQTVPLSGFRGVDGGQLHNVIARRAGADSTGALLLCAHYDSVPYGPGAGDDAAAVAAMLETVRVLTSTPLRNDLIILISDGEEAGLLGAKAFVDGHPWAADVRVALNFEGRGNRGPVIMFQTSPDNGWLIEQFAAAAPHPVANSMAGEVYRRMPNDTDFTELRRGGMAGLNFAFIGGLEHYHAKSDTPENLDPRSLYHHGSYMVAMTRQLGNADLSRPTGPDRVYFDLPGNLFVHYPTGVALPLSVAIVVLLAAVIALGMRADLFGVGRLLLGLGAWLGMLVVLPAAVHYGVWPIFERFKVDPDGWFNQAVHTDPALSWALAFGALTAAVGVIERLRERVGADALAGGAALVWAILAVACAVVAPGASFLFAWPLLLFVIGWAALMRWPDATGWRARVPLVVSASGAAVMFSQLIALFTDAMTHRAAFVTMGFCVLAAGLLIPLIDRMTRSAPWRYIGAFGIATLAWLALCAL